MKTNIIKVFTVVGFLALSTLSYAQDSTSTKVNSTTTVTTTTSTAVPTNQAENNNNNGEYPGCYVGFRFMPTFTFLDYETVDNATAEVTAQVSYGWGGLLGFNFSNNVGLQLEVLYNRLAQQFKTEDRVSDVRLDYINIPLLLRLNTGFNKPVNFNVVFGPQLGINTGSSIDADDNGTTTTVVTKIAVKKGDVGFAYGAGLDFNLGGFTSLDIGFRGVYGLVNISDNSYTTTTSEYYLLQKANVRTYSGYIGLTFGF